MWSLWEASADISIFLITNESSIRPDELDPSHDGEPPPRHPVHARPHDGPTGSGAVQTLNGRTISPSVHQSANCIADNLHYSLHL